MDERPSKGTAFALIGSSVRIAARQTKSLPRRVSRALRCLCSLSLALTSTIVALGTIVSLGLGASPAAALSNTATDTPGIDPDTYVCSQPTYIDFEDLPDGTNLSASSIGGIHFTTTGGYTWLVGDFATGHYNGKYPSGAYTSQGTHWAWLGESEGSGRIDFVDGNTSYFSLLVSAATTVQVDAYNSSGTLLATAGPMSPNTSTGTMDELKITRATPDMAYVIVHDSGNYFEVDSVCSNAPGARLHRSAGPLGRPNRCPKTPPRSPCNASTDLIR